MSDLIWDETITTWETTEYIYPTQQTTMAKNIVNVLVYQVDQNVLKTPQTFGLPVKSIRGTMIPSTPSQPAISAGLNPSLNYKVYTMIPVLNPSNAGVTYYGTNQTVASIVNDINT
jgi:hypothetical protein